MAAILDFSDRTMIQAYHPLFSCTSDMYLTINGIIFSGPFMHTDTPSGTGVNQSETAYEILVQIAYVKEPLIRPRGYKTFYMLNLTEHEISTAHKTKIPRNKNVSSFKSLRCCIYHFNKCKNANTWHLNVYKQDKFRAQLS